MGAGPASVFMSGGDIASGHGYNIAYSRLSRRDGIDRGVIYCSERTGTWNLLGTNSGVIFREAISKLDGNVSGRGGAVLSSAVNYWSNGNIGDSWANDFANDRLDAAYNWFVSNCGVQTKVALVGQSMGAMTATRWAYLNPSKVAGVISVIGALDMEFFRGTDSSPAFWYTFFNKAYGGNGGLPDSTFIDSIFQTILDDHSPVHMAEAGNLSGLTARIFANADDVIATPAQSQAFHDALTINGADSELTIFPAVGDGHSWNLPSPLFAETLESLNW